MTELKKHLLAPPEIEKLLTFVEQNPDQNSSLYALYPLRDSIAALVGDVLSRQTGYRYEQRLWVIEPRVMLSVAERNVGDLMTTEQYDHNGRKLESAFYSIEAARKKGADVRKIGKLQNTLEKALPEIHLANIDSFIALLRRGDYFSHTRSPYDHGRKLIQHARMANADPLELEDYERALEELKPLMALASIERYLACLESKIPGLQAEPANLSYLVAEIEEAMKRVAASDLHKTKYDELQGRLENIKPTISLVTAEIAITLVEKCKAVYSLASYISKAAAKIEAAKKIPADETRVMALDNNLKAAKVKGWRDSIEKELEYVQQHPISPIEDPAYYYDRLLNVFGPAKGDGLEEADEIRLKEKADTLFEEICFDHTQKFAEALKNNLHRDFGHIFTKMSERLELTRRCGTDEKDIATWEDRLRAVPLKNYLAYLKVQFSDLREMQEDPLAAELADSRKDPACYLAEIERTFDFIATITENKVDTLGFAKLRVYFEAVKKRWQQASQ